MNKKVSVVLGAVALLSMASSVYAEKIDFIDAKFDKFVTRLVKEEHREEFRKYYALLNEKMREADEGKVYATYKRLFATARENLKTEHADWYTLIDPYISEAHLVLDTKYDDVRKASKIFLTRYGAYQEFLKFKGFKRKAKNQAVKLIEHGAQVSTWDKIGYFAESVKNKVGGWFGTTTS